MPWNTVFKLWEVFENGVIEQERQYFGSCEKERQALSKLYPCPGEKRGRLGEYEEGDPAILLVGLTGNTMA